MYEQMYQLLEDDTIQIEGRTLYRIQCICEGVVIYSNEGETRTLEKGELGGFVESEDQLDSSWIEPHVVVYGNSYVSKNSYIAGASIVKDSTLQNTWTWDTTFDNGHADVGAIGHSLIKNAKLGCITVVASDVQNVCLDTAPPTIIAESTIREGHGTIILQGHFSYMQNMPIDILDTPVSDRLEEAWRYMLSSDAYQETVNEAKALQDKGMCKHNQ